MNDAILQGHHYPARTPGTVGVHDVSAPGANLPPAVADPSFVVCTVMCYLGIPPSMLKEAVEYVVRAASEQYHAEYDLATARREFRKWQKWFMGFSILRIIKHLLTFAVQGKLGFVPGRMLTRSSVLLQRQLRSFLLRSGVKMGSMMVAEQVLRKVVLVTELAFAGMCVTMCGGMAMGRAVVAYTEAAARGIANGILIVDGVARAVSGIVREMGVAVFVRPALRARVSMDRNNWNLEHLPGELRRDLGFVMSILSLKGQSMPLDAFLDYVCTPMTGLGIPHELLRSLCTGVAGANPGLAAAFFPGEVVAADRSRAASRLERMRLYEFVDHLVQRGIVRFRTDPERLVDEQIRILAREAEAATR